MYSANYILFKSGDIITEHECAEKWDLWFGYPESLSTDFISKTTVSETNTYLESIEIPWRVTTADVVDGVRQWTVA